jgi:3',5'-nucleoside bisphosphate phosphatase
MRYDLHTHSNVSDGIDDPAEVVRLARAAGLDGIALTDHDSTAGLPEARAAADSLGVEVLTGCEVSAGWKGHPVHVLAYFVDPEHPRWAEELRWIRDDRVVRAEKMVERLRGLGVDVTMEQVRKIAKGESIGRPHVAQALVDLGVVPTTPDAFTDQWIGDGGRAYIPKRSMSPPDAVELIVEAGGAAVLAHPIWIERESGDVEDLVEQCTQVGLAGLEVNHPDHDLEWRVRFGAIAARFGLIKTSSSDFHGSLHGGRLGENTSSEEVVRALRARARPSARSSAVAPKGERG